MAIVISDDIVLSSDDTDAGVNNNNPRIGWHNVLTTSNVTASSSASGYPAVNAAIPVTHLKWVASASGVQTLVVSLGSADTVNYFGVVGHNFGTDGTNIKLQSSTDGSSWTDVTDARVPANDYAFMEEFADTTAQYFRLHMTANTEAPRVSILYIGRVLRMQRRLYVGHKPLTLNRSVVVSSGFSENGQFLGRVVRRRKLEGSVDFKNITPTWYRSTFDPFVTAAENTPFFFAWRPGTYPDEVGFMSMNGDPDANNDLPNGFMSISMRMQGIR